MNSRFVLGLGAVSHVSYVSHVAVQIEGDGRGNESTDWLALWPYRPFNVTVSLRNIVYKFINEIHKTNPKHASCV